MFPPEGETMNRVAQLFRELMELLQQSPESERVEILLADLAARVAQAGCTCVGINRRYPLIPAALLLSAYDISLRCQQRKDRTLVLYAQPSDHKASEYKNKVKVRVAKRMLRAV
jgi:hypothetical protein